MATLRCPECLTESSLGTFYCEACGAALLPIEVIPAAARRRGPPPEPGSDLSIVRDGPNAGSGEGDPSIPVESNLVGSRGERRYRIILGDTCPVCRAASRISFTADRPPVLPVVGCRDAAGCRCTLPAFGVHLVIANGRTDGKRRSEKRSRSTDRESDVSAGPLLYDGATGVFSREAFDAFGVALVSEAARHGETLSLFVLHLEESVRSEPRAAQAGDAEKLRQLGEALRRSVRSSNITGRHGPHALALLAQGAEEAGALQMARGIRAEFAGEQHRQDAGRRWSVVQGIATLSGSGGSLADLVQRAEAAAARALSEGGEGICISGEGAGPGGVGAGRHEAQSKLTPQPSPQIDELANLVRAYERGEIGGVIIDALPGACPACRRAARDIYAPRSLPSLPLSGCTGRDGCRCCYSVARPDPRRRPPPIPADTQPLPDIPRRWHDAALFGSDPKRSCRAEDLAAYLDCFPLLPLTVAFDLHSGEAAYLVRSVRRGWAARSVEADAIHGLPFPRDLWFADWLKRSRRPPPTPTGLIPFWDSTDFCLTNWRCLFRRRGVIESVLLVDITRVEYFQGGIACTVGNRGERLFILVPGALQVGLCLSRVLSDLANLETSATLPNTR